MTRARNDPAPESAERTLVDAAWRAAADLGGGSSAAAWPDHGAALASAPPDAIPGYDLIAELHRGGQGVVFQAVQRSTRRRVAIKVTREGPLGGPRDKARFEREVRILGRLAHPHIVHIHDSGRSPAGDFFVMEFVDGTPFDVYVRGLDPADPDSVDRGPGRARVRAVLLLFAKVCDAVHAAHLHGVIHRDLKPGNILVDSSGEPRVLDFGLSTLTEDFPPPSDGASDDARWIESRAVTRTGQFVGSLPWASPEQAEGLLHRIDIRTDVYSLGVILYQALTGRFPYPMDAGPRALLNHIAGSEPARPSVVSSEIDNDLDTIVLKCLAKEPERRYQSAGELAGDIRRYLADRPILARPPSAAYLLRKFARRNRLAVAAGAVALLTIVFGMAAVLVLWRQAEDQRRQTNAALDETRRAWIAESDQRAQARASAAKALEEAEKAKAVTAFLREMLASVRPDQARGREVTIRQVLDDTSRRLGEGEFRDQPPVEAEIRTTLAQTYRALGRNDDAEPHLRAALEICERHLPTDDPQRAIAVNNLGDVLHAQGRLPEAESLYRTALDSLDQSPSPDGPTKATMLNNLSIVLMDQGRLDEAEPLIREALALQQAAYGEDHPSLLRTLDDLAQLMLRRGQLDESESACRRVLELARRHLQPDHPDLARYLNSLASVLLDKNQLAAAEAHFREALELTRRVHAGDHPLLAVNLGNLAECLQRQGRLADAEPFCRQALEMARRLHGDEHPEVAVGMNRLAVLLKNKGQFADAEALYNDALAVQRRIYGDEHPEIADTLRNLAALCQASGKPDRAAQHYREALSIFSRLIGDDHPETAFTKARLGQTLFVLGQPGESERLLEEALATIRQGLGPRHGYTAYVAGLLGTCRAKQGRYPDAEPLLIEAVNGVRHAFGPKHPRTSELQGTLIDMYKTWGKPEEAARWASLTSEVD